MTARERTRTEIAADILKACCKENRITRIILLTNINHRSFQGHIAPLVREGFLLKNPVMGKRGPGAPSRWTWITTQKGIMFMRQLEEVNKLLARQVRGSIRRAIK